MTTTSQSRVRDPRAVVAVSGTDRQRAISTIVTAFSADPIVRWIYPDPAQYLQYFPAFVDLFAGQAFDGGTAHAAVDFAAAALWLGPGVHGDEEAFGEYLTRSVAPGDQENVFAFFGALEVYFPQESVWYLPVIGVDPRHQGRGHGSALLSHALEKCDQQHMPAYLESTNERNIPLYERYGFEVVAQVHAGGSPPVWPMYRGPR